jgi:predicted nucleic-acid-binding Zn-ribbon protein
MKSNKQRRAEIMARRAARKNALVKKAKAECAALKIFRPLGWMSADLFLLAPNNSYGYPSNHFASLGYYAPVAFTCRDCGAAEVWSAKDQKWWYEKMQGDMFSTAIRCRPCRARERERKQLARQEMLAGLMKKQEKTLEALAKNENSNTHR